jgi:hypothetical protein
MGRLLSLPQQIAESREQSISGNGKFPLKSSARFAKRSHTDHAAEADGRLPREPVARGGPIVMRPREEMQ